MGLNSEEASPSVAATDIDQPAKPEYNLATGLEQVKDFLIGLPAQGISIHGTVLSRAESIKTTGFLPDEVKPSDKDGIVTRGTYVYNFKPIPTDANARLVLKSIEKAVNDSRGWGSVRARDERKNEGRVGLVVMVPPDEPIPSPFWHQGTTEGVAYAGYLPYPVYKDWILGVVPIKMDPKEYYIGREGELARKKATLNIMRDIAQLVRANQGKIAELSKNPPQKATLPDQQRGAKRFISRLFHRINPRNLFIRRDLKDFH